jgi:sodium-dependent dicarboxylate transporter 2/3/5
MKTTISKLWRSLWASHDQTKDKLRIIPGAQSSVASQAYSRPQLVGLLLGPALFLLTVLFFSPEGLSDQGKLVLGITLWIATWWITEDSCNVSAAYPVDAGDRRTGQRNRHVCLR